MDACSVRGGRRRWLGAAGLGLLLSWLLGFSMGCARRGGVAEGVQLVLSSERLEPTTTFELRFEHAMVSDELVAKPGEPSPLDIRPPLAGEYLWLSPRSGVFVPSEPTELGTAYRFRLKPGLKQADGAPSPARLDLVLRTPGLEVCDQAVISSAASKEPQVRLSFNAEVDAERAARFMQFRSQEGVTVRAKVRRGTRQDLMSGPPQFPFGVASGSPLTWKERFEAGGGQRAAALLPAPVPAPEPPSTAPPAPGLAPVPPVPLVPSGPVYAPGDATPVENCVIVESARPLPLGREWKLVVGAGLPARGMKARMEAETVVALGGLERFEISSLLARNALGRGRRLELRLSKWLPDAPGATNMAEWIEVIPAPTNPSAELRWNTLEVSGDFALGIPYQVRIKAGFPGFGGDRLDADYTNTATFEPLPPRVYFPEFTTAQLASGRRRFPLLAVNADQVAVRVKQLDEHTLVHALRGYRSYFRLPSGRYEPEGERYTGLDYNLVPGRTVYTQAFPLNNPLDQASRVELSWDAVLGPGKPGAAFVHAECATNGPDAGPQLGAQAVVQVTDLGLAWKHAGEEAWVYVFSHRTGQAVPDATVGLLTDESEPLVNRQVGPDGTARLTLSTNAVWLMGKKGDDLHACEFQANDVPVYAFEVPWEWDATQRNTRLRGMLFSDRPVYRPGDTVNLKGIVRAREAGHLTIPQGLAPTLRCYDAREQLFLETNLVVTALGSLSGSFPLPRVPQGEYRAEVTIEALTFEHRFLVREYRPNAFEITLKTEPAYGPGDAVEVGVSARYLLGQPLNRAQVSWTVDGEDAGFRPDGFSDYLFCSAVWEDSLDRQPTTWSDGGEAEYRGGTNWVVSIDVPVNEAAPQPRTGRLAVEITDLNQQTLTAQAEFVRHSSDFYLGLRRFLETFRQGERIPIEVVAVRADGQPINEPLSVDVKLHRIEWNTVRVEDAGGAVSYRSEAQLQPVQEGSVRTVSMRRFGVMWHPVESSEPAFLEPVVTPGQYLLELSTEDAGGRPVLTALTFHVYGTEEVVWNYRNAARLELVADAARYQPGETATILVKAPFAGSAWVTVERDRVLRSYVTNLTGNAPAVRVPIAADDAPNVFVSVMLLRGTDANPKQVKMPEYRLGYCELEVESPATLLNIGVTPSAPEYRPGQTVSVAATVTQAGDRPVPGAEVTLFAVDEGVLSLTGFTTPDPHEFFYEAARLSVNTGLSLRQVLPEDPARLSFQNKGYVVGGGGRMAVRQHFLACAFWRADLVTDATGRVQAEFKAPDNLTRYRVMAVAHAGAERFGSGEGAFAVNKPIMIEPAVPTFAHVGDRLTARAMVFNRTDQAQDLTVGLTADTGVKFQSANPHHSQRLTVGPKSASAVDVPVEFTQPGVSHWRWSAQAVGDPDAKGTAGDQVAHEVEVRYPVPLRREIHLARVGSAETNLLSGVDPQLVPGPGSVTLRISASRLAGLGEAIRRLLTYPYGCVEQTASSLLPWLVVRESALSALQLTNTAAEVDRAIQNGVARLWSMQTSGGGLSYWPGESEPRPWGSAYGAVVLALASQRGVAVGPAPFESLLSYLRRELRRVDYRAVSSLDFNHRCLALYALALGGKPEPAYHELLVKRRNQLSPAARAWLALAILESEGSPDLVKPLLESAPALPGVASDAFDGVARESALRLLVRVRQGAASAGVDPLVAELVGLMQDGHWGTTQGNAWALFALSEYAARVEAAPAGMMGNLRVGGSAEAVRLDDATRVWERTWRLPLGGDRRLWASTSSERGWFTQLTIEAQPRALRQPRQDRGYAIQRTYWRLDDDGKTNAVTEWKVGDRVLVTLGIEVRQPAAYVVVDDPLPCVFEAVNPEFKSQASGTAAICAASELDWISSHRELRADRVIYFCDQIAAGRYSIQYLARARAAGTVSAPPARVEEMYHPERFGLTETATFTVGP